MDNYLNELNIYSENRENHNGKNNECCEKLENHSICEEKII
jgi:hypothetical protein